MARAVAKKATERGVTGDALSDALVAELVVAADKVRLRVSTQSRRTLLPETHLLRDVSGRSADGGTPSFLPIPFVLVGRPLARAAMATDLSAVPGFEPEGRDGIDGEFRTARSNWHARGKYGTKSLSSS